jgi:copper chaperone CopZ
MKRKGILDLNGAHCSSCAYTIEHLGRKIKGIEDVRVRTDEQKAYVDYSGSETVLDEIAGIVNKIGYSATVVATDAEEDRGN